LTAALWPTSLPSPDLHHYYKLAIDQGNVNAQSHYKVFLHTGDGIPMDKLLTAHYHKVIVAKRLVEAWNRIKSDIIDSVWCIYQLEWDENQDRKEAEVKDDDYRQVISLDDLRDF
jgi:hypothetical protein